MYCLQLSWPIRKTRCSCEIPRVYCLSQVGIKSVLTCILTKRKSLHHELPINTQMNFTNEFILSQYNVPGVLYWISYLNQCLFLYDKIRLCKGRISLWLRWARGTITAGKTHKKTAVTQINIQASNQILSYSVHVTMVVVLGLTRSFSV